MGGGSLPPDMFRDWKNSCQVSVFLVHLQNKIPNLKAGRPSRSWNKRGAHHRAQVTASAILRPIGVIDSIVNRSFDGFEGDFPCHAGGGDPIPSSDRRYAGSDNAAHTIRASVASHCLPRLVRRDVGHMQRRLCDPASSRDVELKRRRRDVSSHVRRGDSKTKCRMSTLRIVIRHCSRCAAKTELCVTVISFEAPCAFVYGVFTAYPRTIN
jgi:hypothetical protein